MAIAYVGSGTLGWATTTGSITVPSATDGVLLLVTQQSVSPATATATLNGVSLTARNSVSYHYSVYSSRVLYIVAPPSGSQTLTITGSPGHSAWIVYSGVDQTTPLIGTDVTQGTSEDTQDPSAALTSATGRVCVMGLSAQSGTGSLTGITAGGDSTLRYSQYTSGLAVGWVDEAGAASPTLNAADTGTDPYWGFGAITVQLNPGSSYVAPELPYVYTTFKSAV